MPRPLRDEQAEKSTAEQLRRSLDAREDQEAGLRERLERQRDRAETAESKLEAMRSSVSEGALRAARRLYTAAVRS